MNDINQDDLAIELYYKLGPQVFTEEEHVDNENEPSEEEVNWDHQDAPLPIFFNFINPGALKKGSIALFVAGLVPSVL